MGINQQTMKKYITVPTKEITLPDYNFKLEEPEKFQRLLAVIKKRGQTLPIQVREVDSGYEVITGKKVFRCLSQLGVETVIAYNHGPISDHEAWLIYLESDLQNYETDDVGLAELITNLTKCYGVDDLLNTLPFTVNQVNVYLSLLTFDWDSLEKKNTKKSMTTSAVSLPAELTGISLQQQLLSIYGVGNYQSQKIK